MSAADRVRVAHVSDVHRPLDVRMFVKEARTLAAAGFDVHVLAPAPPAESRDGVTFHAVPASPPMWRLRRALTGLPSLARAIAAVDPHVVHVHDVERLPLALFCRRRGRRVVYDVHEDYPREARHQNRGRPLRGWIEAIAWWLLERLAAHLVDGVVAATPAIAAKFPAARTVLARNYPSESDLALDPERLPPFAQRPPVVVYVGNITAGRGLDRWIEALARVPAGSPLRLRLVGRASPATLPAEVAGRPGADRIDWVGFRDRAGVAAELAGARAGLVVLPRTQIFVESLPVKLFEYMLAGLPVIASDFAGWRGIVAPAGAGVLVDPDDPAALAAAMAGLVDDPQRGAAMGCAGRAAARRLYTWEREAAGLLRLYARLAAAR